MEGLGTPAFSRVVRNALGGVPPSIRGSVSAHVRVIKQSLGEVLTELVSSASLRTTSPGITESRWQCLTARNKGPIGLE